MKINKITVFVLTFLLLSSIQFVSAQTSCSINGEDIPCSGIGETAAWFMEIGFVFVILLWIVSLAGTAFWALMLVHASSKPIENKALWITLIILLGLIGAIIYYFAVRRKFNKSQKDIHPVQAPPSSPAVPTPPTP